MGMVADVIAGLKATREWNDLVENARRIPELEARIAALEARLAGGGSACPACGAASYRMASSVPDPIFGRMGKNRRTYCCGACAFSEERLDE